MLRKFKVGGNIANRIRLVIWTGAETGVQIREILEALLAHPSLSQEAGIGQEKPEDQATLAGLSVAVLKN